MEKSWKTWKTLCTFDKIKYKHIVSISHRHCSQNLILFSDMWKNLLLNTQPSPAQQGENRIQWSHGVNRFQSLGPPCPLFLMPCSKLEWQCQYRGSQRFSKFPPSYSLGILYMRKLNRNKTKYVTSDFFNTWNLKSTIFCTGR